MTLTYAEAKDWAKNFLGESRMDPVPRQFLFKRTEKIRSSDWTSLKPDLSDAAPSFNKISKNLSKQFKEEVRYAYKDENGNPQFYILRLIDRSDSSKKSIRPLSYGYYNEGDQKPRWGLKAFTCEKRSLYNLHQLKNTKTASILILEGEKAADAASKLFPENRYLCMTWCGGASAVSKSDWSPLNGKNVVIWPDNDKSGFKASDEICTELRKIGAKSIKVVDKDLLEKELPPQMGLGRSSSRG